MTRSSILLRAIAIAALLGSRAEATGEICGNGIDDDGNGLTDEGCYPTLTTGLCESPLSCGDTGMVSWSTGSLHYDLPPDIAPAVPYGPGIGFRRFYTSMYSPSGAEPTTVNHTPLGPNWQHTYMTWLYAFNDGTTNRIVLHTSSGRDVYYTDAGACGSYECYTPQAGDHVLSLKVDTANNLYYVQLLTGETLKYNSYGQISEIWDTVAPTPNKVHITWDSTDNGNVSTVTDASGTRRLFFSYTNNLLTSIQFQIDISGTWTTEHTTTYDYTNGVTRDATSHWFVPQDSTEWTALLEGTGIPNPTNLWQCQESSGNLADSIGTATLTAHNNGGMSYAQSVSGWSRKAVKLSEGYLSNWSNSSLCNPKTTKCTALGIVAVAQPTSQRSIFGMGDTNGALADGQGQTFGAFHYTNPVEVWDGTTASSSGHLFAGGVYPWFLAADPVNDFTDVQVGSASSTPTWQTGTSASGAFTIGSSGSHAAATASYLYMAEWNRNALTRAQQTTVYNRIMNGAGLSSVTIGGQLAQQYTYDGSGFLTKIADGAGNQIVAFGYSSTNPGEVDLVTTSRGTVGFEYHSARRVCSGETVLYFNQGTTGTCSTDSDCGTGYLCGGLTGSGSTGKCFLAARCLTTSTANGESVVTNVSPLGPGGGACTGACTDVMQYLWSAPGSGNVNVVGREDPLTHYTDITYNSNGLPTQIAYGASDPDPIKGSPNRIEYISYDTTFPGRPAQVLRSSDISGTSCDPNTPSTCVQTTYTYGTDNQLSSVVQHGWTYNSSGTSVSFDNETDYTHDSQGRLTEIDVLPSGGSLLRKSTFDYFSTTDPLANGFLQDSKMYTDGTHYLEPQILSYDFWGHPTALKAPDGNLTCDAYDSARGFLSSRRHAMANQTDCSTTNSADLTTSWARDSWLRLTQLTRPDGTCVFYTYDTMGRPNQILRRDDCNAGSAGDTQQYDYTIDSLVAEIDTYDASSTLTASQPYTYYASRRLEEIVNPVTPSTFTGLTYDDSGKVTEVDGAGSLAKTVYHFDDAPGRDDRVTSEERFKTSTTSDTWSLLYAWMGAQSQVSDPDSKVTGSTRDDLGRLVEVSSPDLEDPTLSVYDAADQLTTTVEDLGGTSPETHSFSYDDLGRRLNDDYAGRCTANGGTNHPWIQRTYDAVSNCPTGMTNACTNTAGRLAEVETVLLCTSDATYTDGSIDQFTWFAYDDAGHLIDEYTTDDTGRADETLYAYTKNGALSQVTTPSGAVIGWTFGSSGNESDADLVTSIQRNSSNVVDSIAYEPFGPWTSYNWEASISGTTLKTTADRNYAYRITAVHNALEGTTENAEVAITEDDMGRVTSRVYTPHDPTLSGLFDSYFTYDEQSRVVCEATTSGTCPTSGSTLKNNHDQSVPFKDAGDWKEILRPIPGSTGVVNNFNSTGTTYGTSHQVTDVNQSDGTPAFGHTAFGYDVRGERSYDDNTTSLTHDRRDYTYDARHNVINVRGQYYTGSAWHYYDVASAFDHKNRRVFKSFQDETTGATSEWFFYYDVLDRLTEVKYVPDSSTSTTYSVFQLFWLGNKLVLYWQSDFVGGSLNATSKRYVAADETDRPIQLWNWPSSGDATRVWAINPSAWGMDTNILGATVYQPILFGMRYQDTEAAAYEGDGATVHRSGVCIGQRTYDPFIGSYLQPGVSVFPGSNPGSNPYQYELGAPGLRSVDEKSTDSISQMSGSTASTVGGAVGPSLDALLGEANGPLPDVSGQEVQYTNCTAYGYICYKATVALPGTNTPPPNGIGPEAPSSGDFTTSLSELGPTGPLVAPTGPAYSPQVFSPNYPSFITLFPPHSPQYACYPFSWHVDSLICDFGCADTTNQYCDAIAAHLRCTLTSMCTTSCPAKGCIQGGGPVVCPMACPQGTACINGACVQTGPA